MIFFLSKCQEKQTEKYSLHIKRVIDLKQNHSAVVEINLILGKRLFGGGGGLVSNLKIIKNTFTWHLSCSPIHVFFSLFVFQSTTFYVLNRMAITKGRQQKKKQPEGTHILL